MELSAWTWRPGGVLALLTLPGGRPLATFCPADERRVPGVVGRVDVEAFARRIARRPASRQELRDALVLWFVGLAEPRVRRGMRYTDPEAGIAEIRRVARMRARSFFHFLASSFEDPTLADLRRVKHRMNCWLSPDRRHRKHEDLWDEILGGTSCSRTSART